MTMHAKYDREAGALYLYLQEAKLPREIVDETVPVHVEQTGEGTFRQVNVNVDMLAGLPVGVEVILS